jgi:cytochrome P450
VLANLVARHPGQPARERGRQVRGPVSSPIEHDHRLIRHAPSHREGRPHPAPTASADAPSARDDREDNRHAAFGLGIHRCIGSNFARMEITVALEEWLKRIPRFTLAEGARIEWSKGPVRGPRTVPVRIGS